AQLVGGSRRFHRPLGWPGGSSAAWRQLRSQWLVVRASLGASTFGPQVLLTRCPEFRLCGNLPLGENRSTKKFLKSCTVKEGSVKNAHPSLETLAKWLTGDLPYEDLLKLVEHFVTRCPSCHSQYKELLRLKREVGHWDERVAVFEGQQAPELFEQLSSLPF